MGHIGSSFWLITLSPMSTAFPGSLEQAVEALKAMGPLLRSLADQFENSVVAPLRAGEMPSVGPVDELAKHVALFQASREALAATGVDVGECRSLTALLGKAEAFIATETAANARQRAAAILSDVLRIADRADATTPQYIRELHSSARELLEAIAASHDNNSVVLDLEQLTPFQALVDLVRNYGSTTLDELEAPSQTVESAFGRRMVLALMMGRLAFAVTPANEPGTAAEPAESDRAEAAELSGAAEREPESTEGVPAPAADDSKRAPPAKQTDADPATVAPRTPQPQLIVAEQAVATPRDVHAPSQFERVTVPETNELRHAVWRAVDEDRCGLAYHLAQIGHALHEFSAAEPASLYLALALAPHIRPAFIDGFTTYEIAVEDLQASPILEVRADSHADGLARRLAVLAATLRPALLAPRCNAAAIVGQLASIDGQLSAVGVIRAAVQRFSETGLQLDTAVLKGVREHANWESRLHEHVTQLQQWLAQERFATLKYAAATDVWRRWLEDRGLIGSLISTLVAGSPSRSTLRAALEKAIREWSNDRDVGKWLAQKDRELRGQNAGHRPIEGSAKQDLLSRTQNLVALLRDWLKHLESEPGRLDGFSQQKADEVRAAVVEALPAANKELTDLVAASPANLVLESATTVLKRALGQLHALFDQGVEESLQPRPVRSILHRELLSDPDIPVARDWSLLLPASGDASSDSDIRLLRDRLLAVAAAPFNPEQAFAKAQHAKRHDRSLMLLDTLADDGVDSSALARARDEQMALCRNDLQRQIKAAQDAIEQAVCHSLLSADDRNDLQSIVNVDIDRITNFPEIEGQVRSIYEYLARKSEERASSVKQDYDRLTSEMGTTLSEENKNLIRHALENNEFQTAGEYIALARKGEALVVPESSHLVTFSRFCGSPSQEYSDGFAAQFNKAAEAFQPRAISEAIRGGVAIGPFQPLAGSEEYRGQVADKLDHWLLLKDSRDSEATSADALKKVLEGLGFRDVAIESLRLDPSDNCWRAAVKTAPVRSRTTCVVPAFGSEANGHYRLVAVFDRPNAAAIARAIEHTRGDGARIVLYFGRMPDRLRRDCAKKAWELQSKYIVIDDTAFFFSMTHGGDPLTALFDCSLPFAFSTPYASTASLVPPEMFYGREEERKRVTDRKDTNLLFGGRQLGKSALLRDIERREHSLESGRVVRWIDLKNAGIGVNRDANEIWSVIGSELDHLGILKSRAHSSKAVVNGIKDWLNADQRRSMLLLLDEADAFLSSDGKPVEGGQAFPEVALIKGLMDQTDRRFKVVFAGLHNVQRTARDPNTPIGHLGNPICVGPLLDNGGWKRALDLISEPLGRMGFVHHPEDTAVWMRILSYTNYYPSLIQVFCTHLLEHLHSKTYDFSQSPPYAVTLEDVETVYRQQRLQDEIRQKFELTLDLDPRYRLIALLISLECYENPDAKHTGVTVEWVRKQSLGWWATGFANSDSTHSAFRTLLDEMIGLGILRSVEDKYTLRSVNVLRLLGHEDRITQDLDDVSSQPAPVQEFNKTFRRVLNGDPWQRSPLTGHQEATLARAADGVVVVFGSRLAGLDRIKSGFDAMKETAHVVDVRVAPALTTTAQFQGWVAETLSAVTRVREEGVALVVVGDDSEWNVDWITFATQKLSKRSSGRRFVRVVFLADAIRCWELSRDNTFDSLDVTKISLQPWHESFFDPWASHVGLVPRNLVSPQMQQFTGGWPFLIDRFIEPTARNPVGWQQVLPEVLPSARAGGSEDLGFPSEAWRCLQEIARLDVVTKEELPELEELFPGLANRVLWWADNLQLTRLTPEGLVVDPLIVKISRPPTT